ncbi:hypothetical protein C1646_760965 [Rhizophagus diaphanus]|nr:hypothetical protein C1646_760965 [Rhizophagus diaphanus] [Rhizophagus sp. MUCL 43196]
MSSVKEDSSKENKSRKLTSWIWQYFKEETKEVKKEEECVNVLVIVCQVKEDSLLAILQSKAFWHFIYELDPVFTMPCKETVRKIIHKAYNYSFSQLKNMLSVQATSVSLTIDL